MRVFFYKSLVTLGVRGLDLQIFKKKIPLKSEGYFYLLWVRGSSN